MKAVSVSVSNITVSFPGIVALDNISIEFRPGKIHAVLGANGSGKSTLVKVLAGSYHPDPGKNAKIRVGDVEVEDITHPSVAQEMGIRVVHQEAPLINSLSVAECVALYKGYPKKAGRIQWKALYQYVEKLFALYSIQISPKTSVSELSASERGMVAIAIALGMDEELKQTKLLILDEADASIPEAEAEKYLVHVQHVAKMDIPVIMVTHRLKEVWAVCDDITILNDGRIVYSGTTGDVDESFVISKMLRADSATGDEHAQQHSDLNSIWKLLDRKKPEKLGEGPVLQVKDLWARNINGIDFSVEEGEILGFVGVRGSGVNDLPMVIGGDMQRTKGEIIVNGTPLKKKLSPSDAIQAGIMLQPTDRFRQGGIMTSTLRENMLLPNERKFWHKRKLVNQVMNTAIETFDVRPGAKDLLFGKFSGGNQQKAIIGKWLQLRPSVFVLDDPTYGVDPAARQKIFSIIKEASAADTAVIIFSTEPEQLAALCTRILVLSNGKIINEMRSGDGTLTREAIARWCYA